MTAPAGWDLWAVWAEEPPQWITTQAGGMGLMVLPQVAVRDAAGRFRH